MVQVNVYDLKWNYLRSYWVSQKITERKPKGYIDRIAGTYHKYLTI